MRYLNKEECMGRFSEILSKAVYEKKEVRDFLKTQALKKIDNGYNIFYPFAKNEKVNPTHTFKDILLEYANNKEELEEIEESVPLLNIHIPEFHDLRVSNLNTNDNEIPVLFSKNFYFNGEVVDSLANDEIPGFYIFVVCESGSIRKNDLNTRSLTVTSSLPDGYEYVDKVFDPSSSVPSPLPDGYEYVDKVFDPSANRLIKARSVEYEDLSEKYTERGYIPVKDIDPSLLEAFANSKNNPRATRYLMYYGLKSSEETPTSTNISSSANVKDCIFRFKIAADAFKRLEDIATSHNLYPFFKGDVTNLKSNLSREEVLNRMLSGGAFCFHFKIEGNISENKVVSEDMKVYVAPDKLFNLKIDETRRHKTWFRHTKYTYKINKSRIQTKWFYPLEHGLDTRLNKWDILEFILNNWLYRSFI